MIASEERSGLAAGVGGARGNAPSITGRRAILNNLKRGFALLRDPRISVRAKFTTWGLALGLTALVLAVELPVEALVALLFSHSGFVGDLIFDGVQAIAVPVVLTCLLLVFEDPSNKNEHPSPKDDEIPPSVPKPRQREDMNALDYLERMRNFNRNNPKVLNEQGHAPRLMRPVRS